jgi:hypothetical protein
MATLNKDIANRLAAFERNISRRMFERIKVYENWRTRYNKELILLFVHLDILPFVRIFRLNWICHLNRMGSKRIISQVFNNNPQGSRLRGRPKTDGGIGYEQVSINAKLQIGK